MLRIRSCCRLRCEQVVCRTKQSIAPDRTGTQCTCTERTAEQPTRSLLLLLLLLAKIAEERAWLVLLLLLLLLLGVAKEGRPWSLRCAPKQGGLPSGGPGLCGAKQSTSSVSRCVGAKQSASSTSVRVGCRVTEQAASGVGRGSCGAKESTGRRTRIVTGVSKQASGLPRGVRVSEQPAGGIIGSCVCATEEPTRRSRLRVVRSAAKEPTTSIVRPRCLAEQTSACIGTTEEATTSVVGRTGVRTSE